MAKGKKIKEKYEKQESDIVVTIGDKTYFIKNQLAPAKDDAMQQLLAYITNPKHRFIVKMKDENKD